MKHYRIYDTEQGYQQDRQNLSDIQPTTSFAKQENKLFVENNILPPPYIVPNIDIQFDNDTQIYTSETG